MAQVDPSPYLPSVAPTVPDRTSRTNFATQMYNFFVWMAKNTAGGLYYALANLPGNVYGNAQDAYANAQAAATSASQASTFATNASNAANVFGTSTTSITPTLGASPVLAYATGGSAAQQGQRVRFVSRANPLTNYGGGVITNVSGSNITVAVDLVGSAPAAATDWNIVLDGNPGVGSTLQTAKVSVTTTGNLIKSNAGAQVVSTNAATITLDKAANLGNGWAVTFPQRGSSFAITLATSNSETFTTLNGGPGLTTATVPAGVPCMLLCDGTGFTLTAIPPMSASVGTPNTASVLSSNSSQGRAICSLTATRGFTTYWNGTNVVAALIDNTGAVLGSANVVASNLTQHVLAPIDSTRALLLTNGGGITGYIISFSGTTVTVGTALTFGSTLGITTGTAISVAVLSTGKAVAFVWDITGTAAIKGVALTIGAGTSLSMTNSTAYTWSGPTNGTPYYSAACACGSAAGVVAAGGLCAFFTEASGVLSFIASGTANTAMLSSYATALIQVNGGARYLGVWGAGNQGQVSPVVANLAMAADYVSATQNALPGPQVISPNCTYNSTNFTGSPAARLAKASNDAFLHAYCCLNSLTLRTIALRDTNIVADTCSVQVMGQCNIGGGYGFDVAVFGATAVVVYADSANSNFSTIRTVPLYGI